MEYNELVKHIKIWKNNREIAKERGESGKVKKYSYRINDAEIKKKAMENAMPNEVLRTLEDKIELLERDNAISAETINKMADTITALETRIDSIVNPAKPEIIIESKELTVCPNCGRAVEDMTIHQQKCLKSNPVRKAVNKVVAKVEKVVEKVETVKEKVVDKVKEIVKPKEEIVVMEEAPTEEIIEDDIVEDETV